MLIKGSSEAIDLAHERMADRKKPVVVESEI